jgi:glycosyltransferase involved in cell wall biosynthesis
MAVTLPLVPIRNSETVRMSSYLHPGTNSAPIKKTILILNPHYLPGFKAGGPIQSIAGLVEKLKDEYDFKIICGDRDWGDRQPYASEPMGCWYEYGAAKVLRVPPGLSGARMMIRALRQENYDVLHINGFLARIYSMLPLACRRMGLLPPRPVMLAPRGEFSRGSLSLKHKKKLVYIKLSTWLGFYRGIIWHASTNLEEADIRRSMGNIPTVDSASFLSGSSKAYGGGMRGAIAIAKDMHKIPERDAAIKMRKRSGQLRAVFVSRISPEKNLLFALRVIQGLTGEVTFDIYGPIGNIQYWNKCKTAIAALPANVRVQYMGMIEHERVGEVFAQHDLFLLPSLGENYSHVTCEALSAGCPVLISDRTPWRNLQEKGVGWDVPLEDEGRFRAILQQCVDADGEWYAGLEARAAEFGNLAASDPSIFEENLKIFRHAASTSPQA